MRRELRPGESIHLRVVRGKRLRVAVVHGGFEDWYLDIEGFSSRAEAKRTAEKVMRAISPGEWEKTRGGAMSASRSFGAAP